MSTSGEILVIDMQFRGAECYVCGESTPNNLGIPMYEDLVLPNDWTGEWFGQPACTLCFEAQNALTKPVCANHLRSRQR